MSFTAEIAGRFARDALAGGEGVVCAVFQRSFYLRFPPQRYACIGDASLGRGPLNALVSGFSTRSIGERVYVSVANSLLWSPLRKARNAACDLQALERAAWGRAPREGFGSLVLGEPSALSVYARPTLEALDRWLAGDALAGDAERLIGLGPGLTPSGDDYLGGMLVALHAIGSEARASSLWRWLEPRLATHTSAISTAHLAAAAAGEAHEALHRCVDALFSASACDWPLLLAELGAVGHCSGWDALAGAVAVARRA